VSQRGLGSRKPHGTRSGLKIISLARRLMSADFPSCITDAVKQFYKLFLACFPCKVSLAFAGSFMLELQGIHLGLLARPRHRWKKVLKWI